MCCYPFVCIYVTLAYREEHASGVVVVYHPGLSWDNNEMKAIMEAVNKEFIAGTDARILGKCEY